LASHLEAVRPISMEEILAARRRIADTIVRTPLVKLDLGPGFPDVRLKLENLQPTNSYKIRGAVNALALLSPAERARGVWTISAGNAGQGVAYAARRFGVPCTVIAIETAPAAKLDRMRALGATLIPVSYSAARSCIPSMITTSSPAMPRWDVRSSRTHPTLRWSSVPSAAADSSRASAPRSRR
jgi:threonine dehydratase